MLYDNLSRSPLGPRGLVVLLEPSSELTNPGPDNRVVGSFVVRLPAKDVHPDNAFFEGLVVSVDRILHDVSNQGLQLQRVLKQGAAQDVFQGFADLKRVHMLSCRIWVYRHLQSPVPTGPHNSRCSLWSRPL